MKHCRERLPVFRYVKELLCHNFLVERDQDVSLNSRFQRITIYALHLAGNAWIISNLHARAYQQTCFRCKFLNHQVARHNTAAVCATRQSLSPLRLSNAQPSLLPYIFTSKKIYVCFLELLSKINAC